MDKNLYEQSKETTMRKIILAAALVLALLILISAASAYFILKHGEGDFGFGDRVAVIQLYGTIATSPDTGAFAEARATPQRFKEQMNRAQEDGSVKAIVVDINSPGGSVVASEEIAKAIKSSKKPVVAWMGEMATSGAYYAASAADYIIADNASIVGSIGVIWIMPEVSRLLEKLGINITVVKAGEFKDFGSGYRGMRPEEREMIEAITSEIYDQFLSEVASNRNLSKDYVKSVAEGKIYTATKAKELKLIDEVGDKDLAIKKAAQLANITGEPGVVTYRRTALFQDFVSTASERFGYGFAKALLESAGVKPGLE